MTQPQPDPPPFRVLVCDDQDTLRETICRVLANAPLFHVAAQASTGPECVEEVTRTQPHLIILDVNMPSGGPQIPWALKKTNPDVYILVYSGSGDEQTQQDMLDAGADQYLIKTGRLAPLLKALTQAIEQDVSLVLGASDRHGDEPPPSHRSDVVT